MNDPRGKTGHGAKQPRKQAAAIAALLSRGSLRAAAAASGVSESTLKRWQAQPEFQAAFTVAKDELLEGTINRLRVIAMDGLRALHEVARAGPPNARVSAGRSIMELLFRAIEVQDLAARVDKLENPLRGDDE